MTESRKRFVVSSTVARAAEREERAAEALTLRTLVATNCLVVQFLIPR